MININDIENGIFRHKCEQDGCDRYVIYDDEPFCFTHSPDEGSSVRGYSAFEKRPLTGIKYICYFEDWNGFMDGQLVTYNETFDLDFVDVNHKDEEEDYDKDIVLDPFTEESARAYLVSKGYGNVEFIY
jgi:hypothetical protein